jgi:hypothetical protein
MLAFGGFALLIALGLFVWFGGRLVSAIRAKQMIRVRDCLIIGLGLAVIASCVSLAMAIVAGLGHSECAKKQADVASLLAFVIIVACPLAGLFLYRYYQTLVIQPAEEEEATEAKANLRKLRLAAWTTGIALAIIIVALLGRYSLWPPLMFALRNDYTHLAEFLISAGFTTSQADLCGYRALPYAALTGKTSLAKRMVEHGVDINVEEYGGMTALNWAQLKNNGELAKYLVEKART